MFIFTPISHPLKNSDSATAHTATLVWTNLARQVALRISASAQMAQSVIPVYGNARCEDFIDQLATSTIDDIVSLIRRTSSFDM